MFGTGDPFLDDMLHSSLSSNGLLDAVFTLVMSFVADEVWTVLGRGEGILLHEVDIGFGAGGFVVGIVHELDSEPITELASLFAVE